MKSSDGWTRCSAHRSDGQPCRAPAINGGRVCRVHGGSARQVKLAAAERIAALVDPALTRLAALLNDESSSVALAAVRDVLDRAGYSAKQRLEVETSVAATLAAELGLDPAALLAEAQRLANFTNGHPHP